MTTQNQNKNFKNFTNKFSLTKTLRFELIPELTQDELEHIKEEKGYNNIDEVTRQDKTEYFIKKHRFGSRIIEKDKKRDNAFKTYKKLITYLNSKFIDKALTSYSKGIDESDKQKFTDLIKYFVEYKRLPSKQDDEDKEVAKSRKNITKKINKIKSKLSTKISKHFNGFSTKELLHSLKDKEFTKNHVAGDSSESHKKLLNLFGNKSEEELKTIFNKAIEIDKYLSKEAEFIVESNGERVNVFKFFDKWTTYLSSFYKLRKFIYEGNDYSENNEDKIEQGESVKIVSRILDDNAEIFAKNWMKILTNFNCDPGDESKDKFECGKIQEVLDVDYNPFSPENFHKTLSQTQIDEYNEYVANINKFLNESGKKDFLDKLHKQILGIPKKEENKQIEIEIDSIHQLKEHVFDKNSEWGDDSFVEYAYKKATRDAKVLTEFNKENIDLSEITLNTNKLSYYANFFFGSWNIFKDAIVRYDNAVCPHKKSSDRNECKDKRHKLLNNYNQFNEINLQNFVDALKGFETDWADDEQEKSFAEFLLESVEYGNFNLSPQIFENLEDKKDITAVLFTVFAQYYKTLINGRDWELLTEKKTSIAESDKKSLKELKDDLLQKYELIKIYIDSGQEIPKKQRDDFFKALNYYFTRINEINRFLSIFDYKKDINYKSLYQNAIKEFDSNNNKISRVFNEVRNYATKRLMVEDKVKLTFDVRELLGGWDLNEINNKRALLFVDKDRGKYYLGIIINDEFVNKMSDTSSEVHGDLFKMNYKFVKDAHLSIPKSSTQLKEVKQHFKESDEDCFVNQTSKVGKFIKPLRITKEIFEMNNYAYLEDYLKTLNGNDPDESNRVKAGTKKSVKVFQKKFLELSKNKKYYRQSLHKWINFCKDFLESYPSTASELFDWSTLKKTEEYESLDEFYSDVNKKSYSVSLTKVDWDNIKEAIDAQDILLFEIYNKDFSQTRLSDSHKNLHTLYFLELLSDANLDLPIFKLSGGAEVFFREALPSSEWEEVPENELKNPKTNKKPLRKRRFTQPKILFHFPIEINRIAEFSLRSSNSKINALVQDYIHDQKENMKVIGIDRGEKHLAYYCVVDSDGNIVGNGVVTEFDKENKKWIKKQVNEAMCDSLNEIGVSIVKEKGGKEKYDIVNYQKLLDKREKEREKARKEWTAIEGIKDLKKGYISQVVHKLTHMAVDNNAVIAMEDLNFGFKRGRIRIEKSIYQQLENALLEKLQFFTREKTQEGVRNALQLVGEIPAQYKWGKQQGIVFYVDAKFTSKTCPHCGWRRRGADYMFKVKSLKESALKKDQIKLFYERDKDRFRIEYKWSYKDSESKKDIKTKDIIKQEWETIYSDVDRSYWSKKDQKVIATNPTQRIKEAIINKDLLNGGNLANILTKENEKDIDWKTLVGAFKSLTNLRFDDPTKDEQDIKRDVIQCPKCYFDTRKAKILTNADAVGAYNIARRGLIAIKKIQSGENNFKVHLREWDEFTFEKWDKESWNEQVTSI